MKEPKYKVLNELVETVGELDNVLQTIPKHYSLSCCGEKFAIVIDEANGLVLFDNPNFIDELVGDEEDDCV